MQKLVSMLLDNEYLIYKLYPNEGVIFKKIIKFIAFLTNI